MTDDERETVRLGMTVYVVNYFYPSGDFAGVIGIYGSAEKADAAVALARVTDYPDCTFAIISGEVE